ncbi:MAG: elongation factor P, partial [Pseudomonadota bacterium]
MASTADIRNGLVIRFNNDLYSVVEFLHVKPGKGAAFVRTKLRSLTTGRVLENTFPSGAKLEDVRVERRKYQFLYQDGDEFQFMNSESFEQIPVPSHLIEAAEFLQEGAECEVMVNVDDEQLLTVEIPNFVTMEVTYTEPGIKGDTATNTLKPATVES